MAALEEQHLLADRALGYVELYGAYTETEARYRVDRLLALWDRMDADDRPGLLPRPGGHRLGGLRPRHPPALGHRARPGSDDAGQVDQAQPGRPGPQGHPLPRPAPGRLRPREHPDRLQRGRLLRLAGLTAPGRPPSGPPSWPTWWPKPLPCSLLDRRDRGDFLRSFYRRYEGAPVDRLRDDGWELFHHLLLAKSFPDGFARVRKHRALGHRTVLITGRPRPGGRASPSAVRLHRLCPTRRGRRQIHRPPGRTAAHRRGPGTGAGRLCRGRGTPARGVHGLRRFGQRPAHAGGGRFPGGRQPRGQAGRHRPAPGVACGALAQGRRGQPATPPPRTARPARVTQPRPHQRRRPDRRGAAPAGGGHQ